MRHTLFIATYPASLPESALVHAQFQDGATI
jgi:hypothetical protein